MPLPSLLLASKFMQDIMCYFNRTWAKLSELPPCEIGHCEQVLGEALKWHVIWVRKLPTAQSKGPNNINITTSPQDWTLASASTTPPPLMSFPSGKTISAIDAID